MESIITWIPSLLLGIALSAGSGFRIFVPLLVSNLAAKFGLVSVAENFQWMTLSIATVVEIASYYLTFIDNLLDSVALPASVVAGTLLTTQFLQINDPTVQWGLGILAGGGMAGTIQAGTSLIRLGSTKFTGGLGNNPISSFPSIRHFDIFDMDTHFHGSNRIDFCFLDYKQATFKNQKNYSPIIEELLASVITKCD